MNSEIKICQNCKQNFPIEEEDFAFYKKMKVPPPTFCPQCRLQRRLAFLNMFSLYKRLCDLCAKEMVSIFPSESSYAVYCPPCWWSDKWSYLDHGQDYDFSRPFFEQFNELLHKVPHQGLLIDEPTLVNSSYTNHAGHLKNAYLVFMADFVEDSAYGFYFNHVRDVFDSSLMISSELCYDSMYCYKSSRCVGARSQLISSFDCAFLKDCSGCQNCFASANLRNKKYHIFNKPYSKEAYFEEMQKWDLGSYKTYQEAKKRAEEYWKTLPPKPNQDELSVNCIGTQVFRSRNCKECYQVEGAEDSKYLLMMYDPPIKDCYDISTWGNNLALSYDCCNVGEQSSGLKFCCSSGINLLDAEYCKDSLVGSHQFGCASARKGEYIILNKHYSKEEYEKLRTKIVEHMDMMPYVDKRGRIYKYGEFFPAEISPFAYNETTANGFFPMKKEEILGNGYKWREPEPRRHDTTMKAEELPDHIRDAPDSILNEAIKCSGCNRGYRVIAQELKFLRERNLPLPRECPFCRINEKFILWVKNLRQIPRVCSKCGKEFKTKYTEAEAPVIYCKECYLKEVV
ncbi:MAG: hypothetical protein A3C07_03880 [Candidatus Sungbacteria bacterium RIFCSPHIGHO2_02_FULL_47_11]|uniref:Zinc-binding domain-containing protein n=1 Tax=Candidatus Sungbacteria bacterium RIFCSPHIGHO2_02_FULL_47_11 TaxID=1802270 RepID=A0A1G2KJD2_9BACT|nr:MAG: hypothetical protein A3C07_03880 [Candidatus Sungbacteria bacterium RIFCSPHIGHO2_02_FULL_47_11]